MVKEIALQNGMFALVDDEDYENVNQYKWSATVNRKTNLTVSSNVNKKTVKLSRFLTNAKKGDFIIFNDGNRLNFQKYNLAISNKLGTIMNRRGNVKSSSKYKGVSWEKDRKKWKAAIKVEGKTKNLGRYDSEDKAAIAYNNAALKYLGEKVFLNVIGKENRAVGLNIEKTFQYRKDNKFGFKGLFKKRNKYGCQIWHSGKQIYIGSFDDKESAAKAYDKKAYELYGDKAILNFPEDYKKQKTPS